MNRLALADRYRAADAPCSGSISRDPTCFTSVTNSTTLFNNIVYETARVTNGILQNVLVLVTNLVAALFIMLSVLLLNPAVSITMLLGLAGGYALIYLCRARRLLQLGTGSFACLVGPGENRQREFRRHQRDPPAPGPAFLPRNHSSARAGSVSQPPLIVQRRRTDPKTRHGMRGGGCSRRCCALCSGPRRWESGPGSGELTFIAFAAYRLLPILQQVFACKRKNPCRSCRP